MNRIVLGAVSALLLAGAGLFWWQGQASVNASAPPAPPLAEAEATGLPLEELPSEDGEGMQGAGLPGANASTREEKRFNRLDLSAAEPEARRAARGWALAELGAALTDPDQQAAALSLIARQDWHRARLPRELRPLQVLHGLAARQRGHGSFIPGPAAALRAVRLGLLGI